MEEEESKEKGKSKEEQKKHIVDIMEADENDKLYS
jgi:hypothetical protein